MKEPQTLNYKAIILLLGYKSEIDLIKLNDNITIRKGTNEELENIYERVPDNCNNQQFIVEYNYSEEKPSTYHKKVYKLMDDLNIFFAIFFQGKTKVAYALRYTLLNNKFESIGFSTNTKTRTSFSEEFIMEKEDSERIMELWNKYQCQFNNEKMQIALRRYLFATQGVEQEDQIIDLMIAFEALLITGNTREIKKKIVSRCSKLVSQVYDREAVEDFLRKSYKLRSKIVHGSSVELYTMDSKEKYFHLSDIVNCLSELLVICFRKKITEFTNHSSINFIKELNIQ